MRSLSLALALLVSVAAAVGAAEWEADIEELLSSDESAREGIIDRVVDAGPDWNDVAEYIAGRGYSTFPDAGVPVLRTTVCADTVERPWVLVVPESYDPATPTPLLMVLHGGVGRATLIEDPLEYVSDNEFVDMAAEMGWIAVLPFGQAGATWWDDVGMANIRNLVRTAKTELNVDDDRVWMIGFSDGASAGFAHAMVAPNDYAAFVALNGHIGVGSLDGDLPTFAPNIANTPMYVTTTFDDGLYPSARMRPTIEMAMRAGAEIFYREMPGEHDSDDVAGDLPAIARFLVRHPRDPFPSAITWEAVSGEFGACRWFAIDRVTPGKAAKWHRDHNVAMIDDRITVGFYPNWDFKGPGILVDGLSDGESAARSMGLKSGDLIVEADGAPVDSLAALDSWKEGIERGDEFALTVMRDGERKTLWGRFPEAANFFVFKREAPSARADARFSGNQIDIRSSRLGAFRVLIHPDMFRLDENIVVRVNGETVHDAIVRPDLSFMLRNFAENRDRSTLYVAELSVELD
jgi:predicted esterase